MSEADTFDWLQVGVHAVLLDWGSNPTELAPAHHGWMTWALSLLGLASAAWSIRDLRAYRRLGSRLPS